ncbi:MAG TPA: fatty acid desaturase [Vicinamibacterales bacterium]|nr:fatty acid desaturase [Vicinamibacterales bacterium]
MQVSLATRPRTLLRHSSWDAVLVGLSAVHAAVLIAAPAMPVVAIGLWWNANTIAHNFIHAPFFRSPRLNRAYSIYLSALQGIPQTLWRHRHLQHHAGRHDPIVWSPQLFVETAVVFGLWSVLAIVARDTFLWSYVPGYALGLTLCALQGHFEHVGGTTSHYGRLYNLCFFNDGYHVEHHRRPGEHWTRLPRLAAPDARRSRWPPVLRWLDVFCLETLEKVVLRSSALQRFMLATHSRALRRLMPPLPPGARITIVGGGLFPRTALILRRLLPDARLTIVDHNASHLASARAFLQSAVEYRHALYDADTVDDADVVIVPLAFVGDREVLYRRSPAAVLLVHDWLWRRRSPGVAVSWLLLKRLNLVTR